MSEFKLQRLGLDLPDFLPPRGIADPPKGKV